MNYKHLYGISESNYDRLIKVTGLRIGSKMELALTSEKNIWLTTNKKGPAQLYLTLTSRNKKVKSENRVVMFSKATLKDHVARFKEIELVEGDQLVEGYYIAEVDGYYTDITSKIKKYLKRYSIFKKLFKNVSSKFFVRKIVLLSDKLPSKFDKDLKRYLERTRNRKISPMLVKQQAYQTLISLLDMAFDLFKSSLEKTRSPKRFLREFTEVYAMSFGPVFQGIVTEHKKAQLKYKKGDEVKSKEHGMIVNYAAQVGNLISGLVKKASKKKRLTRKEKKKLTVEFNRRIIPLKQLAEIRLKKIEDNIHEID